jgi:hypothetical protein
MVRNNQPQGSTDVLKLLSTVLWNLLPAVPFHQHLVKISNCLPVPETALNRSVNRETLTLPIASNATFSSACD